MRGTSTRIAIFVVVLAVAASVGRMWYSRRTLANGPPGSMRIIRTCNELLTVADFVHVCPSAASLKGLNVRADTVNFPTLLKCGVSVTAPGAYTFYISADVFRNAAFALGRFRWRLESAMSNSFYKVTQGNVLGLGETYASYINQFLGRELIFQRDHVYVEVAPSGRFSCSDRNLQELGRLLYERVAKFEPYAG